MGERKWLLGRYFIKSREKKNRDNYLYFTSHPENSLCWEYLLPHDPYDQLKHKSSEQKPITFNSKRSSSSNRVSEQAFACFLSLFSSLSLECNCQLEKMEQPAREGKTDNLKPSMAEQEIKKSSSYWNDQINFPLPLFVHLCNVYFTCAKSAAR